MYAYAGEGRADSVEAGSQIAHVDEVVGLEGPLSLLGAGDPSADTFDLFLVHRS